MGRGRVNSDPGPVCLEMDKVAPGPGPKKSGPTHVYVCHSLCWSVGEGRVQFSTSIYFNTRFRSCFTKENEEIVYTLVIEVLQVVSYRME